MSRARCFLSRRAANDIYTIGFDFFSHTVGLGSIDMFIEKYVIPPPRSKVQCQTRICGTVLYCEVRTKLVARFSNDTILASSIAGGYAPADLCLISSTHLSHLTMSHYTGFNHRIVPGIPMAPKWYSLV